MEDKVEIPEDVEIKKERLTLTVESNGDKVSKKFTSPKVDIEVEDGAVKLTSKNDGRKSKAMMGTYRSHIENMVEGVQEGYVYKLKSVYAHFPMNVKKSNNQVVIQNFIGERSPRKVDIIEGVSVDINDDEITVSGPDKEQVSQTAASIEQECYKGTRDPRVFQDGVYITQKGGER